MRSRNGYEDKNAYHFIILLDEYPVQNASESKTENSIIQITTTQQISDTTNQNENDISHTDS